MGFGKPGPGQDDTVRTVFVNIIPLSMVCVFGNPYLGFINVTSLKCRLVREDTKPAEEDRQRRFRYFCPATNLKTESQESSNLLCVPTIIGKRHSEQCL